MKTKLIRVPVDDAQRALDLYRPPRVHTCGNRIQLTGLERWPGSNGGEAP